MDINIESVRRVEIDFYQYDDHDGRRTSTTGGGGGGDLRTSAFGIAMSCCISQAIAFLTEVFFFP